MAPLAGAHQRQALGARPTAARARRGAPVRAAAPLGGRPRPEYIPNRIDDPNYVRIFDTTLRDGEQSPGATLTSKEKLEIAKQLSKLGASSAAPRRPLIFSPSSFFFPPRRGHHRGGLPCGLPRRL